MLEIVERLERGAQERIELRAEGKAGVDLLRTIPRFGTMTATAVLAAIDGVERFTRGKQLGAYFRLVPIVQSSGETVRHGSITKR